MWEYFPRQVVFRNFCVKFSHENVTFHGNQIRYMQPTPPCATSPPATLVRALRRVLRPLVRLMLAQGITYTYCCELLKGLFVDVAEKDFRIGQDAPTDSRVSLISGVHRKEVSRLRQELRQTTDTVPGVVSLGAQLVAVWLGTPRYLDEVGQPLPLARFASEGGELSFQSLVAGVNSDIRPRVVLDEWMRLGVARFDELQRVCLNVDAFVPVDGYDEKAYYLGHNLHDPRCCCRQQPVGRSQTLFGAQRALRCIEPSVVTDLAKQSERLGMNTLLALNKNAMALERTDAPPVEQRQRMTFGIYFYTEPTDGNTS